MKFLERLRAAIRFRWTYFYLRTLDVVTPKMAATIEPLLEATFLGEGEALPSYYRRPKK